VSLRCCVVFWLFHHLFSSLPKESLLFVFSRGEVLCPFFEGTAFLLIEDMFLS